MALDSFYVAALARELNDRLCGAKLVKIYQPEKSQVILNFYNNRVNTRVLLSAGAGLGRIYITNSDFENPADPPVFCKVLRKYLNSAVLRSVIQYDFDRIIVLNFTSFNEMEDKVDYSIIIEMIGRYSNIILLDNENRIVELMVKRANAADNARIILPGMFYTPPRKQDKYNIKDISYESLKIICGDADRGIPLEKWLLSSFAGLSPVLSYELSERANNDYKLIYPILADIKYVVESENFTPYLYLENDIIKDFSAISLNNTLLGVVERKESSFSDILDRYFSDLVEKSHRIALSSSLKKDVVRHINRMESKILKQKDELHKAADFETSKQYGELIVSNIYRIKKGDFKLVCVNFYSDGNEIVEIPLDCRRDPQANAQIFFRDYKKKKSTLYCLTQLIHSEEDELDYLKSVLYELETVENAGDICLIRNELIQNGLFKGEKYKPVKTKATGILHFFSEDGYEILVGKNNLQNEELTFKDSKKNDIWLHIKSHHGSHVVIKCTDTEPSQTALELAARLAVEYSEGRNAGKQAVDYTTIRNVSKHPCRLPGRVLYRNYKTIIVN